MVVTEAVAESLSLVTAETETNQTTAPTTRTPTRPKPTTCNTRGGGSSNSDSSSASGDSGSGLSGDTWWVRCTKCSRCRQLAPGTSTFAGAATFECNQNKWDRQYNRCTKDQEVTPFQDSILSDKSAKYGMGGMGANEEVVVDVCDVVKNSKSLPQQWKDVLVREAGKVYGAYTRLGVQLDARAMCLREDMLSQMLELLQIQRLGKDETAIVLVIGMGDGREQVAVAAACSAVDWEGPDIKFVGIEVDAAPVDDFNLVCNGDDVEFKSGLRPVLVQEDMFMMTLSRLQSIGDGATHLYSTAPVSACFSAIVAQIPTRIPSITTVTMKKELLIDDDILGKAGDGIPFNLLRSAPAAFVENRVLTSCGVATAQNEECDVFRTGSDDDNWTFITVDLDKRTEQFPLPVITGGARHGQYAVSVVDWSTVVAECHTVLIAERKRRAIAALCHGCTSRDHPTSSSHSHSGHNPLDTHIESAREMAKTAAERAIRYMLLHFATPAEAKSAAEIAAKRTNWYLLSL